MLCIYRCITEIVRDTIYYLWIDVYIYIWIDRDRYMLVFSYMKTITKITEFKLSIYLRAHSLVFCDCIVFDLFKAMS